MLRRLHFCDVILSSRSGGNAPHQDRQRAGQQQVQSSSSVCWVSRLTSPGLIPGPANTFPATSATASASSPSCTGTLFRTNSTARYLSASYARKFRTKHGFPSESKVVTRTFQPAGILATYAPHFRDVKTPCVIIVSGTAGDVFPDCAIDTIIFKRNGDGTISR
jgi:hypothetical protein